MSFQAARVRSIVFGTAPALENPATYEIKEDGVITGHYLLSQHIEFDATTQVRKEVVKMAE